MPPDLMTTSANAPRKRLLYLPPSPMELTGWNEWMVKAAAAAADRCGLRSVNWQRTNLPVRAGQLLRRAGLVRAGRRSSGDAYLTLQGHVSEYRLFPVTYLHEVIPYCYDCWPNRYPAWEAFLRRHRVRVAFFAARQNAERFAAALPGVRCQWVPEGCPVEQYRPARPLADRPVDVTEFGRSYPAFWDAVGPAAKAAGVATRAGTGGLSRDAFFDLLGESKVSVCFPRTMTHPDFAGGVETMTLRYLEIMASGSLPLGHCPAEMESLFGYNPVVELDWPRAGDQLLQVLRDVRAFQPLVDKNLEAVRRLGTWDARMRQMVDALAALGYDAGA
jgi:hypothetical protein